MNEKKVLKNFLLIILILISIIFFYSKNSTNKQIKNLSDNKDIKNEEIIPQSNIIKDVNYVTKDNDGNDYTITAEVGEIDYLQPNIIYLTNVYAIIRLKDSSEIKIRSNYGKYNSDNFDTIFTKNVIIKYLDNKINGEYVDFSLDRNSMIISKKVIYTNLENILKADVVEINIKTKDTKIFMYEKEKKVNIKSKN